MIGLPDSRASATLLEKFCFIAVTTLASLSTKHIENLRAIVSRIFPRFY
jgi:hypothetical protein